MRLTPEPALASSGTPRAFRFPLSPARGVSALASPLSMKTLSLLLPLLIAGVALLPAQEEPAPRDVIDLGAPSAELVPVPSHVDLVRVARAETGSGLDVYLAPGVATYPGIVFRLDHPTPDLSAFGYIEARVVNTSSLTLNISLRADSARAPAEQIAAGTGTGVAYLKPGEAGVARVYFAYPKKGSAPIDPRRLTQLFIFIGKDPEHARSFRLESITAGGLPGALPPNRS